MTEDDQTNNQLPNQPVLQIANLTKSYPQPGEPLVVLENASLTINSGEVVALVGPSGSGKSTLLQVAGLLDDYDSGEISIDGITTSGVKEGIKCKLRLHKIGFIYQFHYLLSEFTALENVMLPRIISGGDRKQAEQEAKQMLEFMRLDHKLKALPSELSGGEQQRIAIARSLINKPRLILADEPTGNLDQKNAEMVFDLFATLMKETSMTVLLVTHNLQLAQKFGRQVTIRERKLVPY